MRKFFIRLSTLTNLGIGNVLRVCTYKLLLKYNIHPVQALKPYVATGPIFTGSLKPRLAFPPNDHWLNKAEYFSYHKFLLAKLPDWHSNPFLPGSRANSSLPWWRIPDFDPAVGDIKSVWETSRFDWLIAMAQRTRTGSPAETNRMNEWLQDWVDQNPAYLGVNWKCGQEASIRVMRLAVSAFITGESGLPTSAMLALLKNHMMRISPTIGYAVGQQNNHGTSEAAALFIGGSWLFSVGHRGADKWMRKGIHWLEKLSKELIMSDGTFSQYSLNYHRLMLDSFSFAEVWRRHLNLPRFSDELIKRLQLAILWLQAFTDLETGHVPNLGANDGTLLLPLTPCDYRDFRPSLQLASVLFFNAKAVNSDGPWNELLKWLDLDLPTAFLSEPRNTNFPVGGFGILREGRSVSYFHYPRFKFRPSQSDLLHLDLWVNGKNILRDGGSFSYADSDANSYFSGVRSHNSVEFGGRDQMPRLGRFLFGAWPITRAIEGPLSTNNGVRMAASYNDWHGNSHLRKLFLTRNGLRCTDHLSGDCGKAILRWRLPNGNWKLENGVAINGKMRLSVRSDESRLIINLGVGEESLYYLNKQSIPVLEVTTSLPATLRTELTY